MKKQKLYRGFLLFVVFLIGIFFMFGCMSAGDDRFDPSPPDTSYLDSSQQKKYDDLTEQKEKLKIKEEKHQSNYDSFSEQMQHPTPSQSIADIFTAGKSEDLRNMNLSQKMTSEQLKIDETRAEIRQIEQEIDKLLDESKKSCFPKDTKILMADGSYKPIDQIAVEDRVMTYDIGRKKIGNSRTNAVYISENNHLYIINDTLKATAYERFLTKNGWKKTRDIKVGDSFFDGKKFILVNSKKKIKEDLIVYNLNIDTSHNFFIYNDNIGTSLVHNTGGGNGGGGK